MLTIDTLKRIESILESMLYISNGSRTGNSLIHEHAFSEPHLTEKKGHAGPDVYTHCAGCSLAIPCRPHQLCWGNQDAIDLNACMKD